MLKVARSPKEAPTDERVNALYILFFVSYERKTSFRLRAFFGLVLTSQLFDANGSTTLHPSWL